MYPKTLQVTAVVAFYMTAALVMVFVNKAVLNSSPELPLLFLFVQLTLAVILLHAGALVTKRIEIPKLELDVAKKLVPVVLVNIIGLIFNTLCLRDVEASFFQIARGLVLPLTISVSSAYTHKSPPAKVIIAAAIVSFGFFLGVTPSSNIPVNAAPSTLSLFYGIMSSLFIAFHAVFIKSSLPHCNNSTIQLAYWTNAGSAIFLIPFILLRGEQMLLQELTTTEAPRASVFFWGSLVTGVFGFLLCVAGLLSIKITSPITHMFSSALRSVLQTVLGVLIFHDILTVNRAVSIFVTLAGTMYYTWIKSVESFPMPPHRGTDPELGKGDRAKDGAMLLQEREKNPNDQ
jgi:GDP-fucose transporter C1